MIGVGRYRHQRFFHPAHDLVAHATVHRARHPPWTLRLHLLADHRFILVQELGGQTQRIIQQRLMTPAGGEHLEQPRH